MILNNLKLGKKLALSVKTILLLFATIAIVAILKISKRINATAPLHNEHYTISTFSTPIPETEQEAVYSQRTYSDKEHDQYLAEG